MMLPRREVRVGDGGAIEMYVPLRKSEKVAGYTSRAP